MCLLHFPGDSVLCFPQRLSTIVLKVKDTSGVLRGFFLACSAAVSIQGPGAGGHLSFCYPSSFHQTATRLSKSPRGLAEPALFRWWAGGGGGGRALEEGSRPQDLGLS